MEKKSPGLKRHAVAAAMIASMTLLAGCSVMVVPKNAPPVKGTAPVSLARVSLIITNGEADSGPYKIRTDLGVTTEFRGNRKAWSQKLVEIMAEELSRRGARVRSGAPLAFRVAVPEITFTETRERYEFSVKAVVISSKGWTKDFTGTAGVSTSGVWSISSDADQLAGEALADAVKSMLGDSEFLAQLRKT